MVLDTFSRRVVGWSIDSHPTAALVTNALGMAIEQRKPSRGSTVIHNAPPPEPEYPYHDKAVRVTHCGRICMGRRKINLSTVFAGQLIGIREVDDQIWLVSFLDYDLGFFDREEGRVEPAPNPFGPEKVLTMSPE